MIKDIKNKNDLGNFVWDGWKDDFLFANVLRMDRWMDGRMEGWKDGRMEGWTDGRKDGDLEKIVLCGIIGHRPLWGHCPKRRTRRRRRKKIPLRKKA